MRYDSLRTGTSAFMAAGMAWSGFVGGKSAHTHAHSKLLCAHFPHTNRLTGRDVNATLSRWDIPQAVIRDAHSITSHHVHTNIYLMLTTPWQSCAFWPAAWWDASSFHQRVLQIITGWDLKPQGHMFSCMGAYHPDDMIQHSWLSHTLRLLMCLSVCLCGTVWVV